MLSCSSLPAGFDMLEKNTSFNSSDTRFRAKAVLSFSQERISVWMPDGSTLFKSPKVNIKAQIFPAASLLHSSNADRNRLSVARPDR
jgi:hypothetical protein